MFLATDRPGPRHRKIRSFLPAEPVIAILLAAVDFEWTARRAIVALGTNTNRFIRDEVLRRCHGADDYREAWKSEVSPRFGGRLPQVVGNWQFLRNTAFLLRNQVVHGLRGMPSSQKAQESVEAFLEASTAVTAFASARGVHLFGRRLPVRRKVRPVVFKV